ncbi:1-aminocyclopropane-1-carboxylate oxidase homolog 11 [Linum perenne]
MISPTGAHSTPTTRTAHFLKPTITSFTPPSLLDCPLLLSHNSPKPLKLNVSFPRWKSVSVKWKLWAEKMAKIHKPEWEKAGIFDAVMNSVYQIERDDELVFGLAEKWCCKTNSFVFPWGEATLTLEDMAVYGFSVSEVKSWSILHRLLSEIVVEYSKKVGILGELVLELLSEALGLASNRIKDLEGTKGLNLICHYYPACPQPQLTMGACKHADNTFITILLQDNTGGLQVLHKDQWVHIPPLPHALVVNLGDLLQLISNDKFISAEHRVLSQNVGPRVSIASFFSTGFTGNPVKHGPIEELLSKDDPPKYRHTTTAEFNTHYFHKGLDGTSALVHFKL